MTGFYENFPSKETKVNNFVLWISFRLVTFKKVDTNVSRSKLIRIYDDSNVNKTLIVIDLTFFTT